MYEFWHHFIEVDIAGRCSSPGYGPRANINPGLEPGQAVCESTIELRRRIEIINYSLRPPGGATLTRVSTGPGATGGRLEYVYLAAGFIF